MGNIQQDNRFCLPKSTGASVLPELLEPELQKKWKSHPLFFTKNRNDVFNEWTSTDVYIDVDSELGATDRRGYDVDGSFGGTPLREVLSQKDLDCEAAELTVIGTVADMCVMTSVVHAKQLGYTVRVLENLVLGGEENIIASHKGWKIPEPLLPADCWLDQVYKSSEAAGRKRALSYMQKAGAIIVQERSNATMLKRQLSSVCTVSQLLHENEECGDDSYSQCPLPTLLERARSQPYERTKIAGPYPNTGLLYLAN